MAQFRMNASGLDPYKAFQFMLKLDGRYVAGVSKVSTLKRTVEVVMYREGGDPSISRGSPRHREYEVITLERGVTQDSDFNRWVNEALNYGAQSRTEASLRAFRKNITIDVYNEAGQMVLAYNLFRCWPLDYQALPDLAANSNAGRDRDPQARERRLGARLRNTRAFRKKFWRALMTRTFE